MWFAGQNRWKKQKRRSGLVAGQLTEKIIDIHEIAAKQLKNKDLLKLTEQAKEKSMLLLDEHEIYTICTAEKNP